MLDNRLAENHRAQRPLAADGKALKQVRRSALVAVRRDLMFDIINDIARYPEFVPWCWKSEVRSHTPGEVVATLHIRKGLLRTHFTTRNTLSPPSTVELSLVEGSFRRFAGTWKLEEIADPDGRAIGCRVNLELSFELAGALGGALFEGMFEHAAVTLVDAFVVRARQIRERVEEAAVAAAGLPRTGDPA
jgi:ribosome-associated toxin RatA of RatAB toxin-antitoxin module